MRFPTLLSLGLFLLVSPALGQAPAHVDCSPTENGKPASGSLRVLDGDRELAKGTCGKGADVPAGAYDVVVALDGAADAPDYHERVTLAAGQAKKVAARFETGELLVQVSRGGRRGVATVRVLRSGKAVATLSAGVASRLSTGTYSVEVESRGEKRTFETVTVSAGERRAISVEFPG
jgi:hypothetical protein